MNDISLIRSVLSNYCKGDCSKAIQVQKFENHKQIVNHIRRIVQTVEIGGPEYYYLENLKGVKPSCIANVEGNDQLNYIPSHTKPQK